MAQSQNKTQPTDQGVADFLANIEDAGLRQDSQTVTNMMAEITGEQPKMWGTSIVGFGQYRYKYPSGREGEWMKIGFSPRKANLTFYLSCDVNDFTGLLPTLGKHTTGKGCLYVKKLSDINLDVLRGMLRTAYKTAPSHTA